MTEELKSVWLVKIHDHRQDDEAIVCQTKNVAEEVFRDVIINSYLDDSGRSFEDIDKAAKEEYWESGDDTVTISEQPVVKEV